MIKHNYSFKKISFTLIIFALFIAVITPILFEKASVSAVTNTAPELTNTPLVKGTDTQATSTLPLTNSADEFGISIPSIGLSHIVKTNVDPRYKDEYLPVLDDYVAHGKFTKLPSPNDGRVYLYAHSKLAPFGNTPKAGYFSHINKLENGDEIFLDYEGQKYTYKVNESKIVEPSFTEVYTGVSDKAEVVLQACYPPGTTDKRILVFAELESID